MDDPELFEAVMERPEPQREAAVREACAGDPERTERMLALVRMASAHEPRPPPHEDEEDDDDDDEPLGPSKGERIDRYVVISRLGAGAFGQVHEAFDLELERRVALKMLHRDRNASEDDERRFRREALALAQIDHPNVVKVWDAGTHEGRRYLTMELVEGTSLRPFVAGQPSWSEVLDTLLPAADGLRAAHEAGIVHRDFKPENVLLDAHGRVVVTDFGIARVLGQDTAREPSGVGSGPSASASSTRSAIGTPRYMAPEQLQGEASPASDQYALCRVICEALGSTMGVEPLSEPARDDHEVSLPDARGPRWLRRILARGLAQAPGERFPDLAALMDEIETHRRRRRWAWRGAALVGLAIPVGAAATMLEPEPCDRWDAQAEKLEATWAALDEAASQHPAPEAAAAQVSGVRELSERALEQWARGRTETCELRATSMIDEPTARARDQCLSHWWDELRHRLEWAGQHPEVLANPELLAALPRDPLRCLHVEPAGVEGPPLPPGVEDAIEQALTEATDLRLQGDYEGSEQRVRDAQGLAERAEHDGYRATTLHRLGTLAARLHRPALALELLQDALRLAEGRGLDGLAAEILADLAETLALHPDGRAPEAEPFLALARAKATRTGGRFDELRATLDVTEGHVALQRRQLERAASAYRRAAERFETAYGPADHRTAAARTQLTRAMSMQGHAREAAELAEEALATRTRALGAHHPLIIDDRRNLGILYVRAANREADPAEAEALRRAAADHLRAAAEQARETLGPRSRLEAKALVELAALRIQLGEIDETVAHDTAVFVAVLDDPSNREVGPAERDRALRTARTVHHHLRQWSDARRLAARLVELHAEPTRALDPLVRDDELSLISYEIHDRDFERARRRLEAHELTHLAAFEDDEAYRRSLRALWEALPDLPTPQEDDP